MLRNATTEQLLDWIKLCATFQEEQEIRDELIARGYDFEAGVVESVNTRVSNTRASGHAGSTPASRTRD